ncbi:SGNH/GDSL hydrolase family protein [Caldimonas brevitalea]|uniref:SGNH hydrolase-type esterase domain-containing protein n=1 Tax=Caldimonas brevitalea TaxID=413882 RepID=A0A0G3BQR5_9BURK|nr:SGNH/GDSL hydrolase family protein [Caldimonas brevitalea]AKJ30308.1 hypothetical protein AAW51_3617 [Caldimonas brevitalea]
MSGAATAWTEGSDRAPLSAHPGVELTPVPNPAFGRVALDPLRTRWWRHAVTAVSLVCSGLVAAQPEAAAREVPATPAVAAAPVSTSPWADSFAAFEQADKTTPPPPGGVVFVGSSSIRLWSDLEQQFELPPVVLKRGFGGSTLRDCAEHADRLVTRYRPRLVVVYAGDNDLAQGRTPDEVLDSFAEFVRSVRRELPAVRIAYVSIKPSPSRRGLMPLARQTNEMIERYTGSVPGLAYIDVYTPMLGADGEPREELFGPDALHLNQDGYGLWKRIIEAHLR